MGDVVILPVVTSLDLPVERVLDAARAAGLTQVVVIGMQEDGSEYFASNQGGGPEVLWHLERAKLKLLRLADE